VTCGEIVEENVGLAPSHRKVKSAIRIQINFIIRSIRGRQTGKKRMIVIVKKSDGRGSRSKHQIADSSWLCSRWFGRICWVATLTNRLQPRMIRLLMHPLQHSAQNRRPIVRPGASPVRIRRDEIPNSTVMAEVLRRTFCYLHA
jgi:hypothetical protein